MAVAGILATQLTDRSARAKTLTLAGLDLVLQPGVTGNRYGVPIETVHVVEAGPGGVSTMEFTIDDPGNQIVVDEGYQVNFWDVVRDAPVFRGFVQAWSFVPVATGRLVQVRCIGLDALLDWQLVPSLVVPIGTRLDVAVQMCVAASIPVGGVPLNVSIAAGIAQGNQANPIGDAANPMAYLVTITNTTLRDAIATVIDASVTGPIPSSRSIFWIDFYGGLRCLYDLDNGMKPIDYKDYQIIDVGTGTKQVELTHEVDVAGAGHAVFVIGSTVAGTGLVVDGTGLPGPIAALSDTNAVDAVSRDIIGGGYLAEHVASVRGTARKTSLTPELTAGTAAGNVRAGGRIFITDGQSDLPVQWGFRIVSIEKTFNPGDTEDWTFAYGGYRKSVLRQTRHLTRSTLS